MDAIDRIRLLIDTEKIKREELAKLTNIGYVRWQDVLNRRTKLRFEEVESLGNAFPEYRYWLSFGKEEPSIGQISPMTKVTQQDYGKAGKDGI